MLYKWEGSDGSRVDIEGSPEEIREFVEGAPKQKPVYEIHLNDGTHTKHNNVLTLSEDYYAFRSAGLNPFIKEV